MEVNIFIGHHCPACNTIIGTSVSLWGKQKCPGCGGPLTRASGKMQPKALANARCKSCGSQFGYISSIDGNINCPQCKADLVS